VLSKVEYEEKDHDLVDTIVYPDVIIDPVIE